MGKGHFGKRYFFLCTLVDFLAKTIGAAYDKDTASDAYVLFFFDPICKAQRVLLFPFFIE